MRFYAIAVFSLLLLVVGEVKASVRDYSRIKYRTEASNPSSSDYQRRITQKRYRRKPSSRSVASPRSKTAQPKAIDTSISSPPRRRRSRSANTNAVAPRNPSTIPEASQSEYAIGNKQPFSAQPQRVNRPTRPTPAISQPRFSLVPDDKTLDPVLVTGVISRQYEAPTVVPEFKMGLFDKTKVEPTFVIDAEYMEKVNATSVPDVVRDMPGADYQVACSVCATVGITLNNLPSRFTTVMVDGLPLYSSFSGTYAFDLLSVADLNSVEITKGAGSSMIAPDALGGTVNVITARPDKPTFKSDINVGSFGQRKIMMYGGSPVPDKGMAYTVFGSYNSRSAIDDDGDGVTESPQYARYNAGFNLFTDDILGFRTHLKLDIAQESRFGGTLSDNKNNFSGNPFDFTQTANGSPAPSSWRIPGQLGNNATGFASFDPSTNQFRTYNGGSSAFLEGADTQRQVLFVIGEREWRGEEIKLSIARAAQTQDSFYSGTVYNADHVQYYLEAKGIHTFFNENKLTYGLSYRTEDLTSKSNATFFNDFYRDGTNMPLFNDDVVGRLGTLNADGRDNYSYRTPGVFANYFFKYRQDTEANASLRLDQNNVFGLQYAPRLNVLHKHDENYSSRFAVGTGYRFPSTFFETDHGLIFVKEMVRDTEKPERSINLSYNLSFDKERFRYNIGMNYTQLIDISILEFREEEHSEHAIQTNGGGGGGDTEQVAYFTNAPKPVTILGTEFSGSYDVSPRFVVGFGAEYYQYDVPNIDGVTLFARPEYKTFLTLDYDYNQTDLFTRITYVGPQDLDLFYGNDRYNLDGSQKSSTSPGFIMWDALLTIKLNERVEFYQGINNILNFTQAQEDSYLFVSSENPAELDTTNIWGPNVGRYIYLGFRYSI